jgi:phytoene dehydrogenase-like protein
MRDVIIIGAGHNALVAAFYLAKAGYKPLVLERRSTVGGACVTEEFHPDFDCSTLADHATLLPQILNDLQLARHGLEFIKPAVRVVAPSLNSAPICLYEDAKRTAEALKSISAKDAASYPEFSQTIARIGSALRPLLTMTPPSVDSPTKTELWNLGKLGWAIRGLGRKDEYRLLRYGPMAVADLAAEWFENETLRAIVAARGIFGAFAGPWSAGTSAALLLQAATDGSALLPTTFVRGGMGSLTQALAQAAVKAGAEVRTDAEVDRISVENGKANGVVLASGEHIPSWTNVSGADPGVTFAELIDLGELTPSFRTRIQNYRAHGTVAKVHLALLGLPEFAGIKDQELLSGRIHIGPEIDYVEHAFDAAKYGDFSERPYMDITIPTIADPTLAPDGAHVMSIHAQFAPFELKKGNWETRRDELGDAVVNCVSEYVPRLKELIVGRKVLTPVDLAETFKLTGGHIHHGEMSLDQLFAFRPVLGCAQYRTPIEGLYLCGAGTHPGGGITGAPGFNASREIIRDLRARSNRKPAH